MTKEDIEEAFNAIRDGSMDFDDFMNGWLDNYRNICFDDGFHYGVSEEREACAKLCEDIDKEYDGEDVLATWCADRIRKRGAP